MFRTFETTFAGRPLIVETGKMAQLANGSCLVRWGETVVMVNITASKQPREGIDFFPLSVDYEEKLYSVGKIPGGFLKREGKPTEKAILASRAIDRPIRPLFPKDLRNDVVVVATVLSVEQDNQPEIAAFLGTAISLAISDIPFNGPIASVGVGLVDGELIVCPNSEQRAASDLDLTVAGSLEKIVMIEAGANQVDEKTMLDAIKLGHVEIKRMCEFINDIAKEIGKEKFGYQSFELDKDIYETVRAYAEDKIKAAIISDQKEVREGGVDAVCKEVTEHFQDEIDPAILGECLYKLQKMIVRGWLVEGKRVDGRAMDEIRPLAAEVGLLPRVHGSGLFTRGQTQVMTIATLGAVNEAQFLDGIDEEDTKRYMHQYNFPSYSVGDARPSRGPGRREIGHGALAERALAPVIPSVEEFPYSFRLVSEVLSSNGSTSQGSICGSTLALMDAGVPIKAPVAGISTGLVTYEGGRKVFLDIQGIEDFFGDMDFKVGGTHKGITAIQVDIKVDGLTYDIIEEAFEMTRKARIHILDDIMLKAIPAPRAEVAKYAPKMFSTKVPVDKIREVIGAGGKVIQKIVADTGAKIDIEDDGSVFICAVDADAAKKALAIVEGIVSEPEVGAVYQGKVTKLMAFGAFVEYLPGKEGLVHISQLDTKRVEKVEDVVTEGDEIMVKIIEIDRQGRVNLSRKEALLG
ncbi:MAG: polyribonucleotide nucleotidyltransferase [Ruminococcaceae bacterium]|nr:polyribonucleotide nucleotidyltransferase [Oscillospiraceae bacterium]